MYRVSISTEDQITSRFVKHLNILLHFYELFFIITVDKSVLKSYSRKLVLVHVRAYTGKCRQWAYIACIYFYWGPDVRKLLFDVVRICLHLIFLLPIDESEKKTIFCLKFQAFLINYSRRSWKLASRHPLSMTVSADQTSEILATRTNPI